MQFFLGRHKKPSLELLFWIAGLVYLALINPAAEHFSFCLLKNLGFEYCPGCGLGASISHFLHGDVTLSFSKHPLGIFASILIVHRIITLIRPVISSRIEVSPTTRRPFARLWRTQG